MTSYSEQPGERRQRVRPPSALRRLTVSAAVGLFAAVAAMVPGDWLYAPAVGWDVTAVVFCGWVWLAIWPLSAAGTASHATAEDPNRATSDLLMLSACVASLIAVGILLVQGHAARPPAQALLAAFSLISVAVSWFTLHTIFALRYARLYYGQPAGGIGFNQDEPPNYRDFAYLAVTIGMTFQVSDTNLQNTQIRSTALRHALLSYFFGAIILAASINLVAGLGSGGGLGTGH
jgi:uncharacterized membrane protein